MAYDDSGFGITSIEIRDESIRTVPQTTVLSIVPSLHPVFSSDGKNGVLIEMDANATLLDKYGSDFGDIKAYGQQNLNVQNVLSAGGTAYVCRLLPEDATTAHLAISFGIKKEQDIPVYKRDIYGDFLKDENGNKIPLTVTVMETETIEDPNNPGEYIDQEVPVEKTVTMDGFKIKTFVQNVTPEQFSMYNTTNKLSSFFKNNKPEVDGYKTFPLLFMAYYADGRCGNDYGLRIINDIVRDERVSDGRRYELFLVKKTKAGAETLAIGNDLAFSFNPYAVVSSTVPVIEGLQKVYQNYDGTVEKQIRIDSFQENYQELSDYITELLAEPLNISVESEELELHYPKTMNDFDFVNGLQKNGYVYDNVVVDETSADLSVPKYMTGGTDGEFETLTGEELEASKTSLLKKFFNCQIDTKTITNVLKCDSGIVYDANYPMEVKREMANLLQNRRDLNVVFDCGFEENIHNAVAVAKQIRGFIPAEGSENFAIVPHCGTTVDRATNVRVTGTYEFSYGLTRLYKNTPFALYAGKPKDYGCVRRMIFDWVVEESIPKGLERKLAEQNCLYWAMDFGKAMSHVAPDNLTGRNVYFYSNANLYTERVSKLAEFRNSMIVNDLRRMMKLVLCKYTFDTDGADSAIAAAHTEMVKTASTRYPSNVEMVFDLHQTNRDRLINQATCVVTVTFPDIFEKWKGVIIVKRNEIEEN